MKYRFVRYRFFRYWFRFVSKPWLDTDIPSKHSTCLQDVFKTSGRHVFKKSWRRLQPITIFRLLRRIQGVLRDIFNTSSRRICKISSRCLQCKTSLWRLGRRKIVTLIFKTCFEDVFKTYWRPQNVCWVSSRTESQYLLYDQRKRTFILS